MYYGILNSAITIGSMISSVFLIGFGKKFNKNLFISLGFMLQGVEVLSFGTLNSFVGGFISLVLLGIAMGVTGIYLNTVVQEEICLNIEIAQ